MFQMRHGDQTGSGVGSEEDIVIVDSKLVISKRLYYLSKYPRTRSIFSYLSHRGLSIAQWEKSRAYLRSEKDR